MQFYATTKHLNILAQAYFPNQEASIELVKIDNKIFRLLVVDGKRAVSDVCFLDYLQPLEHVEPSAPVRRGVYVGAAVHNTIEVSQWNRDRYRGLQPAPFVDWSRFATFAEYEAFLQARSKRLLKDQQRRGRRLAEQFDDLAFQMDDKRSDVLETAFEWKMQQLHDTGISNYLADSRNRRYLELLRENDLLTASTLRGDGQLLSVWLGFVHDGVWSGWIFTYNKDSSLQKYSLGHQLLHCMLKESKRLGHREFDFSIGDEDYKWFYSTHVRVVGPVGTPPFAIQVGSGIQQAARRAKGVLEQYPTLLRVATSLARTMRRNMNVMIERVHQFKKRIAVQNRSNRHPRHSPPNRPERYNRVEHDV